MEKRTFTSAEARHLLKVDAKTFLRWLKKAEMEPTVSRRDNRVKLFSQQQLEALAQEHERPIDFEALQQEAEQPSAEERIERLERRMTALERKLEALSAGITSYQHKPPPARILREPIRAEEEVSGLIKALDFAAQHHVSEDAARAAFKRQKITTTKLEGQQSHYLTRDQQRQAVAYWQSHGTPNFERCDDPACVCQESKQR